MPVLALVLLGLFLAIGLGLQGWLQSRRSGYSVLRGLYRRPFSKEWWIGEAWTLGFASIAVSAVLELLDVEAPISALSGAARVLGLVLALVGFVLIEWAVVAMGESWRVDVNPADRTALVTDGPFRLVRNPIYSSMMLLAAGVALMVPAVLSFIGVSLVILGLELQVRVLEEPHLLRLHGAQWHRYASHVGRFVPGLGAGSTSSGLCPGRAR